MDLNTEQKVENAIKWIKGLKNTKFKQGKGKLGSKETGFCCLGYACKRLNVEYNQYDPYEPKLVGVLGLKSEEGEFFKGELHRSITVSGEIFISLASLNDDGEFSFRRISTVIKKNADKLFEPEVAKGIKKYFKTK